MGQETITVKVISYIFNVGTKDKYRSNTDGIKIIKLSRHIIIKHKTDHKNTEHI